MDVVGKNVEVSPKQLLGGCAGGAIMRRMTGMRGRRNEPGKGGEVNKKGGYSPSLTTDPKHQKSAEVERSGYNQDEETASSRGRNS